MTGLGESSHPLIKDLVEGGPHYETKYRTALVEGAPYYLPAKSIEGGPQFKTEPDFEPLAKSSY
jgi:hypothetical protein